MNKLAPLILILLLSACGKKGSEEGRSAYEVNQELASYVNAFYNDAQTRGLSLKRNLVAQIVNSDPAFSSSTIGVCYRGGGMPPTVKINSAYWHNPSFTELQKFALIYHELGHCIINRPHSRIAVQLGNNPKIFPASLMYPFIISPTNPDNSYNPSYSPYQFQFNNFNLYTDELFGNTNALASNGSLYSVPTNVLPTEYALEEEEVYRMDIDSACSHNKAP